MFATLYCVKCVVKSKEMVACVNKLGWPEISHATSWGRACFFTGPFNIWVAGCPSIALAEIICDTVRGSSRLDTFDLFFAMGNLLRKESEEAGVLEREGCLT